MKSHENEKLADECISSCSQCCYKGKVLLFPEEFNSIKEHLEENSEKQLEEFHSNCESHDGFYLLRQNNKCQFLDERNLCTLHDLDLKPAECFWWPAHFYSDEEQNLEIRLADYCCNSFKSIKATSEHITKMKQSLTKEKVRIIKKFREIYNGNYQEKLPVPSE